jgi:hypothetical protein
MKSHGGSATVIYTDGQKTFLLSCGHCFRGGNRDKPITFDGSPGAPRSQGQCIDVDYGTDLSLIKCNEGGLPFVCQPAGPGYHTGQAILSVGYDNMTIPSTQRQTHIIREGMTITWTQEPPWHGRSGGGLLDLDSGQIIGVVSGYVTYPAGPGIYASHDAICRFLEKNGWHSPSGSVDRLQKVDPYEHYQQVPLQQPLMQNPCPQGH